MSCLEVSISYIRITALFTLKHILNIILQSVSVSKFANKSNGCLESSEQWMSSSISLLWRQQTLGFSAWQSPVLRPWMYPRPLFYLLPYTVGITVPKGDGRQRWNENCHPQQCLCHGDPSPDPAILHFRGCRKAIKGSTSFWVLFLWVF